MGKNTTFGLFSELGKRRREIFLSEVERFEIVRTVNNARNGNKFIIGGVDSSSVSDSIRTAEGLVDAGAEMIRIRNPRPTKFVTKYFEQVVRGLSTGCHYSPNGSWHVRRRRCTKRRKSRSHR
ncbi:MAG: hypothetical protein Ct9H300mP19_15760 [Dehalococcoidia bacterium]|nr:MAG: hypothetical protein Ct9H300mP19_15760 [Dehalococcoidia bacterium]